MTKKFRIAAQMFGFRNFTKTPEDLLKTLKRIKKIGYDYVQISGCSLDPKVIKDACDKAGVAPIGAHMGIPLFRKDEKQVIADCKTLGIKYVAIPWLNAAEQKTAADWKKLFKEFDGYAKRFAKEGITVQYHNHDFEFQKLGIRNGAGGKMIIEMLYDGTTDLQAELDLGWVARGLCNPVDWINRVKGRMDQVHFKDFGIVAHEVEEPSKDDPKKMVKVTKLWPDFRAVGEGNVDWAACIAACRKTGVKDIIVEQDGQPLTGDDPFKSYAISRKNLTEKYGI